MTNEEKMAHEYAIENWEHYEEGQSDYDALKQAYLAGLKAGRPKWHDLRKNPTDVPKENVTVLLLTEVEPVTARYDNKYEAFFRLSDKLDYCVFIAPMSYIAWCEIPTFTDKE